MKLGEITQGSHLVSVGIVLSYYQSVPFIEQARRLFPTQDGSYVHEWVVRLSKGIDYAWSKMDWDVRRRYIELATK